MSVATEGGASEPIVLEGVVNFRDFGGHAAAGGRVKTGRLFRSGHHGEATDADLARLNSIDWALVADLRRASERTRDPARRPASFRGVLLEHEGPPEAAVAPHLAFLAVPDISAAVIVERMTEGYRGYPFDPTYVTLYRRFFAALAEADGAVLVNCHAGKDRTGVLAALTLAALGVGRDEILEDYLLTNTHNRVEARIPGLAANFLRDHGKPVSEDLLRQVMRAEPQYLEAAFATIESRHGATEAYLNEVLGVTPQVRAKLYARLLD
jgi:protein tyrosine/serine phosphatase